MIEIKREGDGVLVVPGERLVASMCGELKEKLRGLLADGVARVEFDFTALEIIDSVGIGVLIATHNSLQNNAGSISVRGAQPDVVRLLQTMRLDRHFDVNGSGAES